MSGGIKTACGTTGTAVLHTFAASAYSCTQLRCYARAGPSLPRATDDTQHGHGRNSPPS